MPTELVNQTLMSEIAVQFKVGADILEHGNRTIAEKLGASNMSGDTVSVTITDSGRTFSNSLDISGLRGTGGIKRGSVPLRVSPIGTFAEASEGELTLAIEKPKVMQKRVANLQDEVNKRVYRGVLGTTQPYVCPAGLTGDAKDRAYREACFDAEAHIQTSKLGGDIYGMAHPQTWNRVVPTLHANFGNGSQGRNLYQNELGDFMGYKFTKGTDSMRVKAQACGISSITVGLDGQLSVALANIAGYTGKEEGEIYPMPVLLTDDVASNGTIGQNGIKYPLYCVDAFGKPTGIPKAVFFKWRFTTWNMVPGQGWIGVAGQWELAQPLFLNGPRKSASSVAYDEYVLSGTRGLDQHGFIQPDYDWYAKQEWNRTDDSTQDPVGDGVTTFTVSDMLTAGKTYLAPMVMFQEDDFLVGVKGLEKMPAMDSLTVPTDYADDGIIPWRGTLWTDPYTSLTLFRVDALMGFSMYQGVSGVSVFLPID